jgi:hypothetical protein
MILKSPAEKFTAGSGQPAGRKLWIKRILVELLSGPGFSGRRTRLAGRP